MVFSLSPQLVQNFWSAAFSVPHLSHLRAPVPTAPLVVVVVDVGVGLVSGEGRRLDRQNKSPPTIAAAMIIITMSGK